MDRELRVALGLADQASEIIARVALEGFEVETKGDGSPVTRADLQSSALIIEGLRRAFPNDALLSEEAPLIEGTSGRVWIIDPLDGTGDFASHSGDYAVMIGLLAPVSGHLKPIFGLVQAPALARTWYTTGDGAFRRDEWGNVEALAPKWPKLSHPRALISRGHLVPKALQDLKRISALPERRGSVGVKIGLIVDGMAEIYHHPALGTSLWDCAAPEAIAVACGCSFTTADGAPICYDDLVHPQNPRGILAGEPNLCARLLQAM